jgi:TonB-dependent SusC/RagA subfamily outer membrane receptor
MTIHRITIKAACLFSVVACLLIVSPHENLFAQASVKGKITDATTQETLPAATVTLTPEGQPSAKKIGAISKKDGTYLISNVPAGKYNFKVTYIGYKTYQTALQVDAGAEIVRDVALTPDVKGLEEVVVTGVVNKRFKSESEVAVSTVEAAELTESKSYGDLSQLLAGKASGVHMMASSGNVGSGVRFDVRSGGGLNGSGQPVIYIDGVRIENRELINGVDLTGGQSFSSIANLVPQDIQSIDILKGPAASALYGTSGENGVVVIKTKSGQQGGTLTAPNYEYHLNTGWNSQAEKYTNSVLTYKDANAIFHTGPFVEQLIDLAGSSTAFKYYASFSSRNEDGIIQNNTLKRNGVRANFSVYPSEEVTLNIATNYVITKTGLPPNDNNIEGFLGNTLLLGPPAVGNPASYNFTDSASIVGIQNNNDMRNFLGSLEALYNPITDLTLRALFGYSGMSSRIDQIHPASLPYQGLPSGSRYVQEQNGDNMNIDLSAGYNWKLASDIFATTTIGMQTYWTTSHSLDLSKQDFPSALITNIGAATKFLSGDETFFDAREAGLFLAQDFNFNNIYLLTLGVRNDYASSVGQSAPSIFYPRAGFAVQLNKLDILPESFNLFKLRTAYGESGSLPGPLDGSNLLWQGTQSGAGTGATVSILGNPSIEPERIREFEVGLEAELNNAYGIDFTYFIQRANKSIVGYLNGSSTGQTNSPTPLNIGAIDGSGFEATVYARLFRTADYQLDLNFQWAYAINEVKSLGGTPSIIQNENAIVVGQPRAAFWGKAVRGALFNSDGTYAGPNEDSVASFLGNPVAPNAGSFSFNFRFLKNFSVYALADWTIGGTIHNLTRTFQTQFLNDAEYNKLLAQLALFPQADTTVRALTPGTPEYTAAANRFAQLDYSKPGAIGYYESSDNLRIREISVGYNFTDLILGAQEKPIIKALNVSIGVRNLKIFKSYSGPDVEINTEGSSRTIYRGQDFLTLQNPRVFYGTFSIGF